LDLGFGACEEENELEIFSSNIFFIDENNPRN